MKRIIQTSILSLLLGFAGGTASAEEPAKPAPASPSAVKRVDVSEFEKLVKAKAGKVIDVRSKAEFEEGHIAGAINIDVNGPDFEKKIGELKRDDTYLVHCQAGSRSARACKKMEKMNFKQLIEMGPGFSGWKEAGKEVVKP